MTLQGTTFRGSKDGKIVKSSFSRDRLDPDEVLVEVTHSGVCGTDLHFIQADMVLGHEGIGIVKALGSACTNLKIGDRVGWGFVHGSCGQCEECLSANDQFCPKASSYGSADTDQGSFSNMAIRKENWLFRVPENVRSEDAAPLMCGGATVFTPLIEYVKATDRVGIVGIGGLGHLAIQFAAKMGCDVVAFSGSESKREEAMKLGAREFYATQGVEDYTTLNLPRGLDRLIITASSQEGYSKYYPILAQRAMIITVTVSPGDLIVPHHMTVIRGIKVAGTMMASRYVHTKMLEFAARHDIRPVIEQFPMTEEGIQEAIARLQTGQMRYRAVLAWNRV
ncbi:GroES-like protein [Marasmius fiardii PR-910]|nr:GroES-like protein [Marasmius fiardii PR-910]